MSKQDEDNEKKVDIKSLVNVIPPASALKSGEKTTIKEKRVKIKKKPEVEKGTVIVSIKLYNEMKMKGKVEISVKGKRMEFRVISQDGLQEIEVWANPEDMVKLGLEDNSTVTLRVIQ